MKAITIAGIVLLVFGVVAIAFNGIPLGSDRDSIRLGPIEAAVEEKKTFPVPEALSILAIGGGIVLIVAGGRK